MPSGLGRAGGVIIEYAVSFLTMKFLQFSAHPAFLLVLLLSAAHYGSVSALQVSGLYSERVAVSNESDAERNRAFREALSAVVLKVTGNLQSLDHPAVVRALNNAQSYVEAISYSSELVAAETPVLLPSDQEPEAGSGQDDGVADPDAVPNNEMTTATTIEQRYVDVDFAASLINNMLIEADIPVWDSNRPSVLVWMSLQNEEGERRLLTAEEAEIIRTMQDFGEARGLPIIFPVLDFEDRRNLSEDLVWTLDEEAIRRASERYRADSVLSGRLHFTASGELVGLWQFIFQDEVDVFDGFSTELAVYLNEPLDRITSQLASYFAIVPEAAATQFVRLRVDGIGDLQDYSSLISYVSSLGLVQTVAPASVQGDRLELQLGLAGDSRQLFELLALDRDLLPIASSQGESDSVLHYRWTR